MATSDPGRRSRQAGDDGQRSVDARGAMGVQVGEHNLQINYTYNRLTWTDGVAPPPLVSTSGEVESPYRGLGAFDERDAAFFFGREAAATQVLERMSRQLDDAGLLVVSGVSGAGKSSLLRAGVVPRIRGAGLASALGAAHWPCLLFTPGGAPLDELAVRVASLAGADAAAVRRGLGADPAGFALTARQAALAQAGGPAGQPGRPGHGQQPRLLLIIDQFEQLFTRCPDEQQRREFISALHAAATVRHGAEQVPAAVVVLVVRADFEARCAEYPQLADAIQHRYLLTAMTELELRMAITEPAKMAGSSVDDDLVEVLLQEVGTRHRASSSAIPSLGGASSAGMLPLLSHALDQAWRNRTGNVLTLADYERTGGIAGAVADSAQGVYEHLTPAQQAVTRQVFTRLTAVGSEGMDTADRVVRAELTEGTSTATTQDVEAVLEAFAAERLLTLAAGTVEISHEVLLTAWPLLRDTWLADTHADRIVRTRLHNTAADWERNSRDPSYLYTGNLLQATTETTARIGADPARNPPLSQVERDFMQASTRAHRRNVRRRQGFIAFLMALVVGLTSATVWAVLATQDATRQRDEATRQRDAAISRQLAVESERLGDTNITASALDSIAAWGLDRSSAEARYAMRAAAASPQIATLISGYGAVNSVAFSPDGKTLATGNADGTARLWNLATGQQTRPVLHGGSQAVTSVVFSPDGEILATGDPDGTGLLWNLATGRQTRLSLGGDARSTASVAFSPDGTKLAATGGGSGSLCQLWDVATGQKVGPHLGSCSQETISVAFSPDGKTLATVNTSSGAAQLWDVMTGRQIGHDLRISFDSVASVAFRPDDKILATGSLSGPARLWNVMTGRQIGHGLSSGSQGTPSVAFSPDGKTLATGGDDGSVRMWDVATGKQIGSSLSTHSRQVNSIAFSPDGKTLATGDDSGAARLWNVAAAQQTSHIVSGGSYGTAAVALSRDGKTLATDDGNGSFRLWDMTTTRQIGPILKVAAPPMGMGGPAAYSSVAFSPDGKILATGFLNKTRLWNTATGQQVGPTLNTGFTSAAFSPDGKVLATADDSVQLWDLTTGHRLGKPFSESAFSVAFSPDGKILATGDRYGTALLWNVATRHEIGSPLRGAPFRSYGGTLVAFSPDGTKLATSYGGGLVWLWNVATGQQIGRPLNAGPVYSVNSEAFSPDGTTLATNNLAGSLRLWDVATGQQIGGPFNVGDGSIGFSPSGKTLVVGSVFGPARTLDVSYLVGTLAQLCTRVGGSLTPAEWTQHVLPGPSYRKICP